MARLFKYASVEDRDFTVTLLSNLLGGHDEECYFQDLLVRAGQDKVLRFIIAINYERFIFHTVQIAESSVSEIEDAVIIFGEFVRSGRGTLASTFYKVELSGFEEKMPISSCLATLSRARGTVFSSLSLPIADLELLKVTLGSPETKYCQKQSDRALIL